MRASANASARNGSTMSGQRMPPWSPLSAPLFPSKIPMWEKGANASKAKRWKCRNCLSEVRFVPTVTTVKENIGFIKE